MAQNVCGTDQCAIQVTVEDHQAPVFTVFPPNLTVNCAAAVPPANVGQVTATDNCGGTVTITHVGDVISNQSCLNRFTIERTYRATDPDGNFNDHIQTITVKDNSAPSFTRPADITIFTTASCTYDASVTATGDVTDETDNCSTGLQATFTDAVANGTCAGEKIITRTWHRSEERRVG